MDPYNQWDDGNQAEAHEMGERAPINYNQNTYMTNDARETSVESLNIDSMQSKRSEYNNGEPRKSYYNEVPLESNFWKYSEQIKSILAGSNLSQFKTTEIETTIKKKERKKTLNEM